MPYNISMAIKRSPRKINYQFKLLYALGIIFIVAGHCNNGGVSLFYEWLPPYSFHLGLFIFASGYLYKNDYEKTPARYYIWKKAKKLLIPLFLWNLFYALLVFLLSLKNFSIGVPVTLEKIFITPITTGHQFGWNLGGWFIMPLFMTQVWNILFRKFILNKLGPLPKDIITLTVYSALGLIGVALAKNGFNTSWWLVLTRFLFFLPFFGFGLIYKNYLEKRDNLRSIPYFAIIFLTLIVLLLIFNKTPTFKPSFMNSLENCPIFMPYLTGILGIAFWLRISRILTPVIGKSKLVNLLADNTYSIMINQLLGFTIVNTAFAALSKIVTLDPGFSWAKFKSSVMYTYLPNNNNRFAILYLIAGLLIPIVMQQIVTKTFRYCLRKGTIRSQILSLPNK